MFKNKAILKIKVQKCMLLSLAIIALLISCKDDEPVTELNYIQGEILFTPGSSASFEEIFTLMDSLGLEIKELNKRQYGFKGNADSV